MSICRHKKSRFWALRDADGALVCVCVYKRGAQEVQRRLQQERYALLVPPTGTHREGEHRR